MMLNMIDDSVATDKPPCLFEENNAMLLSGVAVLAGLRLEVYACVDSRCLGGSIGGHVRHCVEFYRSFLTGLDTGFLDYDARARDPRLENDPNSACEVMRQTARWLSVAASHEDTDRSLNIVENHDGGEPVWSPSSVGRELRFLLSHTVHHYALIAILLRLRGIKTPEGFGIAPSTLRYRKRPTPSTPCAR